MGFALEANCSPADEVKASTVEFSCEAVKCAQDSLFGVDKTSACIAATTHVSATCAQCYGQIAQCALVNCAVQCLADPFAPDCLKCGHEFCDDFGQTCTGFAGVS